MHSISFPGSSTGRYWQVPLLVLYIVLRGAHFRHLQAPIHSMCLVPATLVHTNEVFVPMPGQAPQWMTAPQARREATTRAKVIENDLVDVCLLLQRAGVRLDESEALDDEAHMAARLMGTAMDFNRRLKQTGPNTTEVDVGGEKLVYIEEFEEALTAAMGQLGDDRQSGTTGDRRDKTGSESEAWRVFEAKIAEAEAREAAEARQSRSPATSPGNPFGPPPVQASIAQAQSAVAATRTMQAGTLSQASQPRASRSIIGSVVERAVGEGAGSGDGRGTVASGSRGKAAEGLHGTGDDERAAAVAPAKPVSKFKMERMGLGK